MTFASHMTEYYDRRAGEYDDWWLGRGQFLRRDRPRWAEESKALVDLLGALAPSRVLDVACGTGFLTQFLRGSVTGVDQSAEMLEIARARVPSATFVRCSAAALPFADGAFDTLVTSHFYGHLLPEEREQFLREAWRVADELIVVDAALRDDVDREQWQPRTLDDGTEYEIYKRYFDEGELERELAGRTLYRGTWFVVVATSFADGSTPAPSVSRSVEPARLRTSGAK